MAALLSKCLAICVLLITARIPGGSDEWLTDRALDKALQQPLNLTWQAGPRWELLRHISIERRIALLLDRRVDPSVAIDCEIHNIGLLGAVFQMGADDSLAAVPVGDLVYVGPGPAVVTLPWRLADLRRRIAKLPPAARSKWLKKSTLSIPHLAQPKEVLQTLVESTGLTLADGVPIPHDVWRESEWPGTTVAEQFALLLFGFGLWPEIAADGGALTVVLLPPLEQFEWSYPAADPVAAQRWLAGQRPQAKLTPKSKTVELSGQAEDHFAFAQYLQAETSGPPRGNGPTAQTIVSLRRTTATRQAFLQQICQTLGIELRLEGNAATQLADRVEIEVQSVSYSQLIERVLAGTGLQFQLDARQLRVFVP